MQIIYECYQGRTQVEECIDWGPHKVFSNVPLILDMLLTITYKCSINTRYATYILLTYVHMLLKGYLKGVT